MAQTEGSLGLFLYFFGVCEWNRHARTVFMGLTQSWTLVCFLYPNRRIRDVSSSGEYEVSSIEIW